jgi:TolB-like protein
LADSLFTKLKRRNVFKVGVVYLVTVWLLLQIADVILGNLGLPDWVFKLLLLILAIGFPLVLIFAWAFELTPEGLQRESDVNSTDLDAGSTSRKFHLLIIGTLVLALGYFLWERQSLRKTVNSEPSEMTSNQETAEQVSSKKRSIAVLPFLNMSSDKEQEWFVDGLTEELLNALARTADLLVTARTSSFKYKGANQDIPTIAKALGVENVLEGSVRRSADRIRVTAQLIRASDGFHLWSQSYDRSFVDIIDLQEELAIAIANALETAIDPDALADMVNIGTRSVAAYQSYLEGIQFQQKAWTLANKADSAAALKAFEKAVELDPSFSRAYYSIANSWAIDDLNLSPNDIAVRKIAIIDKAILHEKNTINRNWYNVSKAVFENDYPTALRLNTTYLKSRPNSQDAQASQIIILTWLGRNDESVEAVKTFFERDGYDVEVTDRSLHALRDGPDREFAIKFSRMVIERFPDQPLLLYQVHRTLLQWGETKSARPLPEIIHRLNPVDDRKALMNMRQLCAEGKDEEAIKVFDAAIGNNTFTDEITNWFAYKIMGRDEEAVGLLTNLDNAENWLKLMMLHWFGFFDPQPYPYLMARLESKGIPLRKITTLGYRCENEVSK